MPAFLALIPAWAWITGGALAGAAGTAYVTGEAADKIGDAAEPVADAVANVTKLVAVTGALAGAYIVYRELAR